MVVIWALPSGATRWRASYAGDGTHAVSLSPEVTVTGKRYASTLVLSGPTRIVDETTRSLRLLWTAADGGPVDGIVTIHLRLGRGSWAAYRRIRTTNGRATIPARPRVDSTWRATGSSGSWWLLDASDYLSIENRPATKPFVYPAAAPQPVGTPAQSRARGVGAGTVITRIPASVWRSMVGRSWHRGCPVGRSALKLLRINYWGFDGYR